MQHANYTVKDLVQSWEPVRIQRAYTILFFAHDRIWSGEGRVMFYMGVKIQDAIRLVTTVAHWRDREHTQASYDAKRIVQVMLSPFIDVDGWVTHYFGTQDRLQIQQFQRRWCTHLREELRQEYRKKTNQKDATHHG